MKGRIVILGGGIGGLVAALRLKRRLAGDVEVILVERRRTQPFAPAFIPLFLGKREPGRIATDLSAAERKGIRVVYDEVSSVAPEERLVIASRERIPYDYLIVALGAETDSGAVPGLSAAHEFYSLEGAVKLQEALAGFQGQTVGIVIPRLPFKCPAAPYEAALLIEEKLRLRRPRSHQVHLQVLTAEKLPMGTAGPVVGRALVDLLSSRGIVFRPELPLQEMTGEGVLVFPGGQTEKFDLVIAVPPHMGPRALAGSGLAGAGGWVTVDPHTLQSSMDRIYVIGDSASVPLPGRHNPDVPLALPKAGVFAHSQAEAVADNLAELLQGRTPSRSFNGKGSCFLETGRGLAAYGAGDFFATPAPQVSLLPPRRRYRWGKEIFERSWTAFTRGSMAAEKVWRLGERILGLAD